MGSLIRVSHSPLLIQKILWNFILQSKISIFGWKLLKNIVPVNEVVQSCGIPIVSTCHCCLDGDLESLGHVFLSGPLTRQV